MFFLGQLIYINHLCPVNSLKRATFWVEPMGRCKAQVGTSCRFCYCCLCPFGLLHKYMKAQLLELYAGFYAHVFVNTLWEFKNRYSECNSQNCSQSPRRSNSYGVMEIQLKNKPLSSCHIPLSFQVSQTSIKQKKKWNRQLSSLGKIKINPFLWQHHFH